jgi:hypothetical protein
MEITMSRWSLVLAGVPLLLATAGTLAQMTSQPANGAWPLADYLSPRTYEQNLVAIEPAGFFAVGRRYIHPPIVDFKPVAGAARYEVYLAQMDRLLGVSRTDKPPVAAREGWGKVAPGKAGIAIAAFNAGGTRIGLSRLFPFYVAPPFDPKTAASARKPYRQAALDAFNALYEFKLPAATPAPKDGPGSKILPVLLGCAGSHNGYSPYSFPVLHDWEHADMLRALARHADEGLKSKIRAYARSVGDHLLMSRIPAAGNKYGNLIRGCVDYQGRPALGYPVADPAVRAKMLRLIEPAKNGYAGSALVDVYELTGDATYLDAAAALADTLARTQLENGSWPARVDGQTGEVLGSYSSSSGSVAAFMNRLNKHRADPRWPTVEQRARKWMMDYPVKTGGWVVNYDDGGAPATLDNPYAGSLSNWDLFAFVRYLARVGQEVPNLDRYIDEQLAWNDNMFVFYGSDPLLPIEPWYPCCAEQGMPSSFTSWGGCWLPMDFHTANWGKALVAAYQGTGDSRWLERAKAAANALTQYQLEDGRTMTWMCDRYSGVSAHVSGTPAAQNFWPAAWAMSASLWAELANLEVK